MCPSVHTVQASNDWTVGQTGQFGQNKYETTMQFHLEKYHGKDSRHTCPQCGTAHKFTLYVDNDNQPLSPICGRCDRENECGYHYTPKQFFEDNPDRKADFNPTMSKPIAVTPRSLCTIPFQIVLQSASYRSTFVKWLFGLFGDDVCRWLMLRYALGATNHGDVIFWQIDHWGKVHTGKIMRYKADGHRDHGTPPNWIHATMKRKNQLSDNWELTQCLFGQHLLNWTNNRSKIVAIVESEKSALIGAVCYPCFVWLSTGGKNNLKPDAMKDALRGRKVIIYPDTDTTGATFRLWREKANEMAKFCKVIVSDLLEREATPEQKEKGIDIADWLVEEIETSALSVELTNEQRAEIMCEQSPIIDTLITELSLIPDP